MLQKKVNLRYSNVLTSYTYYRDCAEKLCMCTHTFPACSLDSCSHALSKERVGGSLRTQSEYSNSTRQSAIAIDSDYAFGSVNRAAEGATSALKHTRIADNSSHNTSHISFSFLYVISSLPTSRHLDCKRLESDCVSITHRLRITCALIAHR
jgi:hypothetical protein